MSRIKVRKTTKIYVWLNFLSYKVVRTTVERKRVIQNTLLLCDDLEKILF